MLSVFALGSSACRMETIVHSTADKKSQKQGYAVNKNKEKNGVQCPHCATGIVSAHRIGFSGLTESGSIDRHKNIIYT